MRDRRKVLFVLPSLNGGGAERAAVQILNGLDANQWHRSMFLFAREGPYLSEVDPEIGVASAASPTRFGRWRALRAFVAEQKPDVVMAFLSYFSALSATRAASTASKVVFNLQTPMSAFLTDGDYQWQSGGHRTAFSAVTRIGYGAADMIVATSQGVAIDLTRAFAIDPDRIRVIPNPVDPKRVRLASAEPVDESIFPPGDGPLIVAAGRLAEAKNYPLMIEAFAEILQQLNARLLILGQGELEHSLRHLIDARGLAGAIGLAGFQANPWKYIARADLFLLTSKYEGFGNVLIEAMACGVPVVATASEGTRDIVRDGVDGILVQTHSAAAVSQAVLNVLRSDRRTGMATEAQAGANRFAVTQVIARYQEMLELIAA